MTTPVEKDSDITQRLVDELVADISDVTSDVRNEVEPIASDSAVSESTSSVVADSDNSDTLPLILDRQIQTTLATRVVMYWLACVTYFAIVLFITQWLYDPETQLIDHIRDYLVDMIHWVPAILLLLPLVVFDTLKVSQRFLTPVIQVQEGIERLTAGQTGEAISLDSDGYMTDLVTSYNNLRDSALSLAIAEAIDERLNDPLADF